MAKSKHGTLKAKKKNPKFTKTISGNPQPTSRLSFYLLFTLVLVLVAALLIYLDSTGPGVVSNLASKTWAYFSGP
ncbi:MAG: hypothetical protein AB7P49_20070, partial [Bdellovibrionales bacterium]